MIKYNNNTINDWNFGASNIKKVYRNGAVVYYKIVGSSPTPVQEPCFAVIEDISQYSDTEFEDVFNKSDGKWYKLNNLNQYEQYGVYGSGRNVTTYNGKLTIDGDFEYEWNGSNWVNLGEVSGSSITIKSPEYIERTSTYNGYCSLLEYLTEDTKIIIKHRQTNAGGGRIIGDYNSNDRDDWRFFFYGSTLYYDFITQRKSTSKSMPMSAAEEWEVGNYYIKNTATGTNLLTGSTQTFSSRPDNLYIYYSGGVGAGESGTDYGQIWYIKIYKNNVLVRDFIPWTDMNGNYGLYDKVNDVTVQTTGQMTASTTINDVEVGGGYEYPLEYVVREEPPDNVSFSSMAEAEAYECPWWGMTGIIDNTDYLFCESNEWLTKYAYQEVSGEYICDSGDKYKKMQEYDRQADGTFSPSSNYVKGDLIESGSPDCVIACSYNFCGVDANGNDVIINNGTTTLTSYNWESPYPVEGIVGDATTIIGEYCFQNIKNTITALTIGNSVTTIEHEAFMETENLTTLTIPSSVTQIDFWAFTRCYGMEEVIFEGTTPPTFTNQHSGVFHDYCPTVIYVPDSAVSEYRAIDGSVWTNQSWSSDIIQPISNR